MTNDFKIKLSKLINITSLSITMVICSILTFGVRLQGKVEVNTTRIGETKIEVKEAKAVQVKLLTDVAVIKTVVERIDAKL